MLSLIKSRWWDLVNGFWFVPGLIALCGPLLALLIVWFDHQLGPVHVPVLFTGNSTAATGILTAIAASFMAVLGLVFSITIVTLQLVTSQFTPRALRGFLADRITQSVAGGFLGIFAYALLVLTTVRDPSQADAGFVPALSISVSIVFGLVGLVLLLLFIHHTAESIQINNITARLARETLHALDHLYPMWGNGPVTEDGAKIVQHWSASAVARRIYPQRSGYVQSIAFHYLLRAFDHQGAGLRLYLAVCPGDFVTPEKVIAEVWPVQSHEDEEALISLVRRSVVVLNQRDIVQDAAFGIRQLADIALRAMSPAVNDPTTAVNCIEYLRAIFEHLARRTLPSAIHRLHDGTSMLVMRYRTFFEYVQVFAEIGRVSTQNARVADALLAALESIATIASQEGRARLPLLGAHAQAIALPALADARTKLDRTLLVERLKRIEQITQVDTEQVPTGEQMDV